MRNPLLRNILRSAIAFAIAASCPTSSLAKEPLPANLQLVPVDAAVFGQIDVAVLSDTKLKEVLNSLAPTKLAGSIGLPIQAIGRSTLDVRSFTFAIPRLRDPADMGRAIGVIEFREEYDREKLIKVLSEQIKNEKAELNVEERIVRIIPENRWLALEPVVLTMDLSDSNRIVILTGLPDSYLKPTDKTGRHTSFLTANAKAPLLFGINFEELPDQIREDNLPAEMRPFQPILLSRSLHVTGTLDADRLKVQVAVETDNEKAARSVEKSLDALAKLADAALTSGKKQLNEDAADLASIRSIYDVFQTALSETRYSVEGNTTTAELKLPLDGPYTPFVKLLSGGGASARMRSANNLKQLALAVYNYESAYGFYPPAATLSKKGKRLLSWRVHLLPFLEHEELYKKFRLDEPWDSEHNLRVLKNNPMPDVFAVPGSTDAEKKTTHYQVFVGNGAMFDETGPLKIADLQDGTSNTIMIATAAKAVEWTKPDDIPFDTKADQGKLLLFENGVTQVAFGDGSVRALSEKISPNTLKAIITRNGGEVLGDDF